MGWNFTAVGLIISTFFMSALTGENITGIQKQKF